MSVRRVNLRVRGEPPHILAWRALKIYRIRTRAGWESAYEVYKVLSDGGRLDEVLAKLAKFDSVKWDEKKGVWTMRHGHIEVEVKCEGEECEATVSVNALAVLFSAVEELAHKVSILEERLKGEE